MNGRRWSVLSSKGQLSTARLLPRASICVWSAVWVGSSAESAMANLEPNRSGSANNVSMTSSWHTYSSSHNFVRPPSPAPILTGQAKPRRGGEARSAGVVSSAKTWSADLLSGLRPIGLALRALLCKEGNDALAHTDLAFAWRGTQRRLRKTCIQRHRHDHRSRNRRVLLPACPSGIRCDAASAGEPTPHS